MYHVSMDNLFIKQMILTEQIVIWSYSVKNILLIGAQLEINTFSFQTFTVVRSGIEMTIKKS